MNIGIITQARSGSTRLPGKVLLTISRKDLLSYHLERLGKTRLPIYVATTTKKEDDKIEEVAIKNQVNLFRGSETDVLARYYGCAVEHDLDFVIRVTSDCPFIDAGLIIRGVNVLKEKGYNKRLFVSNTIARTFPRGFDYSLFSFELLKEAYQKTSEPYFREHVTPYFHRNIPGDIVKYNIGNPTDESRFRLTVDEQEDFLLVKELIEKFGCDKLEYQQIITILERNPYLYLINKEVEQKN